MLNIIWLGLMFIAIIIGFIQGTLNLVWNSILPSLHSALWLMLTLAGIMTLWMGLMQIAEDAGLIAILARLLTPLLKKLFPGVPENHPAMGNILMNIAANMLGAGNAATPLGLRAMKYLSELNRFSPVASDDMVTFLAINTSSVQLVPATAIAVLAANGDVHASSIIFPVLLATSCSTLVGLMSAKCLGKIPVFKRKEKELV